LDERATPTPKDTSQIARDVPDIPHCWKSTDYHTSCFGRAQRPFSRSAISRLALFRAILLLFKTNGDRARMQRGEKSERQPMPGAGAASHNEAARERIGWLFCYWHT